jgi:hypothetical protein
MRRPPSRSNSGRSSSPSPFADSSLQQQEDQPLPSSFVGASATGRATAALLGSQRQTPSGISNAAAGTTAGPRSSSRERAAAASTAGFHRSPSGLRITEAAAASPAEAATGNLGECPRRSNSYTRRSLSRELSVSGSVFSTSPERGEGGSRSRSPGIRGSQPQRSHSRSGAPPAQVPPGEHSAPGLSGVPDRGSLSPARSSTPGRAAQLGLSGSFRTALSPEGARRQSEASASHVRRISESRAPSARPHSPMRMTESCQRPRMSEVSPDHMRRISAGHQVSPDLARSGSQATSPPPHRALTQRPSLPHGVLDQRQVAVGKSPSRAEGADWNHEESDEASLSAFLNKELFFR